MKLLSILFLTTMLLASCSDKISNLKVGDKLHGFKLIKKEFIKDHDSMVYLFEHIKTGAKLLDMENDDTNRVFNITFNTYPDDNTGIPHILEHSVLAGSKNFPAKGMFEELKKGSFTTYLNAFTSSDSTSYPIATTNPKEFQNLMHVYLDAVFYPNIYTDPMIMRQEGFRIEYDKAKNKFQYNGVVFNEMKGALGNPNITLYDTTINTILPNSTYAKESGGDPNHIPELTNDKFINFHKTFYHPSNSYTFIYGKNDIANKLKFINDNYFSHFSKKIIPKQNKELATITSPTHIKKEYSIPQNSKTDGKYYNNFTFVVESNDNTQNDLPLTILSTLLTKHETSPISKALIDAGAGTSVYSYYNTKLPWKPFNFIVEKTDANKAELLKETVLNTLKSIVKEGFNQEYITGVLRQYEFSYREFDTGYTPRGIEIAKDTMSAFKFDHDVFENLKGVDELERLKNLYKNDNRFFEKLIEKHLLNNSRHALIEIVPKPGLAQFEEGTLEMQLQNHLKKIGKLGLEKIKDETDKFENYQKEQATPEDIAKIPFLSLKDIDDKREEIPQEISQLDDVTILYYPLFTKGIDYVNLIFDMSSLPEDLIPYSELIVNFLENIRTKNLTLEELQKQKALYTGFAYNSTNVFNDLKSERFYPRFQYKIGTLSENLQSTLDFIYEIIANTQYDDYKAMKYFLKNIENDREKDILHNATSLAALDINSKIFQEMKYNKKLHGIDFYWFIKGLNENFDNNKEEIAQKLALTAKHIFTKKNLVIAVTSDKDNKSNVSKIVKNFVSKLPDNNFKKQDFKFKISNIKTAYSIPGKVQYVVQGGNFLEKGERYSGSIEVLLNVIENEFLHPEIRQKGGAYGAFTTCEQTGNMLFMSYRDPNIKSTLDVYKNVPTFIENLNISNEQLEKYIIGTVKVFDTPKSNKQKGQVMISRYFMNYSLDDRHRIRTDIINTTLPALKKYKTKIKNMLDQNFYSAAGTSDKIEQNKELFNEVIQVIK